MQGGKTEDVVREPPLHFWFRREIRSEDGFSTVGSGVVDGLMVIVVVGLVVVVVASLMVVGVMGGALVTV